MKKSFNENQQLSCKDCQDGTDRVPPKSRTCKSNRRVKKTASEMGRCWKDLVRGEKRNE
jgi:hypothetical protein